MCQRYRDEQDLFEWKTGGGCLSKVGAIAKNGKKEKFAILAGTITQRYDERLSWFVAFRQTRHKGKAKQQQKRRIFPLTSLYLGPPLIAAVYSFYFVREITARCWNCVEKVLICGSHCSRPRVRRVIVWLLYEYR